MGKQYYGQVESITGNSYTVEIHHKTLTPIPPATATEIKLSAKGFQLDYEGQGSATYENNIMGSSCSFDILVESQAVLDGLTAIAESKENDYLLVIYKGQDLFWHGTIVTDQMTLPRASFQGTPSVNIKANDRLKLLSSVDFDFGTFSLPLNRERGLEIIKQIIQHNNTYITALYGASSRYLLDSIENKAANQLDGTLYNVSFKKESFIQNFTLTADFGEEDQYIKCTDALRQILQIFNAQIVLTNGYYVIRHIDNQYTASTEFNAYTKTLSALSTYTISNGINVQDNERSCFEAIPEYTFQPAIREISTEISKSRVDYLDKTTASAVLGTLSNTDVGDLTKLYANIVVKLKDIETKVTNNNTNYWANDIMVYADFWVKDSSGDYYYLKDEEMKFYGNTEPNYYEIISHTDTTNKPNEILDVIYEVRLPNEDIVEYNLEVVARTSWYFALISANRQTRTRLLGTKFGYIADTIAKSRIGIEFSYNDWSDGTADYGLTEKFANDILTANANLSNNVTLGNLYHSGQIADIYGIQYWNNTTSKWEEPIFDLVGVSGTAKAEVLPLIMAANVYENNIKTIEGDLHTNGSIYAIDSINIDSSRWAFNGGTYDAQNELWNGQWIKVAIGSVNTGTGGTKYNDRFRGGNSGLGDIFKSLDQRLIQVLSTNGNDGDAMMQAVFNDVQRTANPTSDESLGMFIDYDAASESYLYNLKEIAGGGTPFNVTSDTSLVDFGATVDITLTGNYFKSDSVVSISKGTLNTTTINSSQQMILNVTAIASSEAVNTCDVTIDGVSFTTLWTYALNYNGTLADDYITARGITNAEHEAALHTLEAALFSANLTDQNGDSTKIKSLYLYGGTQSTAAGHKWNFMDATDSDAAFRETYYGGLTHGSNGITGNGTDGYIDPHFAHGDFPSQNDAHVMTYCRDDITESGLDSLWGNINSSFQGTFMYPKYNGSTLYTGVFSSAGGGFSNTDGSGLFINSRTASNVNTLYRNGNVLWNQNANSAVVTTTSSILGLATDYNNSQIIYRYGTHNICARGYGGGLNGTESAAYTAALNTYFTTLGINIFT